MQKKMKDVTVMVWTLSSPEEERKQDHNNHVTEFPWQMVLKQRGWKNHSCGDDNVKMLAFYEKGQLGSWERLQLWLCSSVPQDGGWRKPSFVCGRRPQSPIFMLPKRLILAQVCLRSARLSGKSACEGKEQPVWLCINKLIPNWNILMLGHRSIIAFEEFPAVTITLKMLTHFSISSTLNLKTTQECWPLFFFYQRGGPTQCEILHLSLFTNVPIL